MTLQNLLGLFQKWRTTNRNLIIRTFLMKYISLIVFAIFFNFTALPSLAVICDWDFPKSTITVAEEEVKTSSSFNEKVTENPLSIHDFLKFFESNFENKAFDFVAVTGHISPFISIFSPPPNIA